MSRLAPRRYIRASLSLNPASFLDRFTAIQCAAGSEFETADLHVEGHIAELDCSITYVTTSKYIRNGSSSYRCHNCRFLLHFLQVLLTALTFCINNTVTQSVLIQYCRNRYARHTKSPTSTSINLLAYTSTAAHFVAED